MTSRQEGKMTKRHENKKTRRQEDKKTRRKEEKKKRRLKRLKLYLKEKLLKTQWQIIWQIQDEIKIYGMNLQDGHWTTLK